MTAESTAPSGLLIRPARPDDVPVLHRFVVELAATEDHPEPVEATPEDLARALFGAEAVAEALVAEVGGVPVAFALHYPTYSTVRGRPGVHLEDLYVRPEHRGSGLGQALLSHLARLAVGRGCARLEWWVLRTNDPALRFYARMQAREVEEIAVLRLDGQLLDEMSRAAPGES
jgi:GNAT superfamily N-acetyltransferase